MKKTFCADTPMCPEHTGTPPTPSLHCGLLIRIIGRASGIFPGQRKFSGLLFKRTHCPHRRAGLGDKPRMREKARLAGVRLGQERTIRLFGRAIWVAFAWLGGRKGVTVVDGVQGA